MNMSVEDIGKLVKQEKDHEAKVRKAKEEAGRIIQEAEMKAKQIIREEAENDNTYDSLLKSEAMRLDGEKEKLNEERDREMERLRKKAQSNMDEAVALVVNYVLSEQE